MELGFIRYYCPVSSGELYKEQIKGGGICVWVVKVVVVVRVVVRVVGRRRKGKILPQNPQRVDGSQSSYIWTLDRLGVEMITYTTPVNSDRSVWVLFAKKNVDQAKLTRWAVVNIISTEYSVINQVIGEIIACSVLLYLTSGGYEEELLVTGPGPFRLSRK